MSPLAAVKAVCAVTVMVAVAVAAVAAAPKARDDILMDDQTEDGVVDQDEEALPFIRETGAPHPVLVNNWGTDLKVGQVAGIAINLKDEPVILHRGPRTWDSKAFDEGHQLVSKEVIEEDPIVVLNPEDGQRVSSFGSGMFYMPHGLTIDGRGDIYVTDVGLHQVFRFPAGNSKPDLVLGEEFTPGSDATHFCQPTDIAVAEKTGDIFVADGYCNSRVMRFSKDGRLKQIITGDWNIPHSLALFEASDVLCVADREGAKIDCIEAGLEGLPDQESGRIVFTYKGVGKPYAIAGKGSALISIGLDGLHVKGLTIDTAAYEPRIIDMWATNDGITKPHDVAVSQMGGALYVAETKSGDNWPKVHKFDIISLQED